MTQKYYIDINTGLKSHLDGAFLISVRHPFVSEKDFLFHGEQGWEKIDSYNILTDDGGLHITLSQTHKVNEGYVTAYVKSSLKSVSMEDVLAMVKTCIETEIFLSYDNYKDYSIEVYDKKTIKEMMS